MKKLLAFSFLLLSVIACKKRDSNKLDGTWTNKAADYTVTINTLEYKFSGVAKGQQFGGNFSVTKQNDKETTLSVNGRDVLVVMNSDKDITVTLEKGAKPMELQKVEE